MAALNIGTKVGVVAAAVLLAASVGFSAPAANTPLPAAAGMPGATVPENERLEFTQKNVQAQMQELQERMFQLAALTREAEPESSTRLLLAVRQAREQLIIEQMKDVLEKLASKDMSHATDETKAVLQKLAELRNLLIATDLDLQLQLERLRQLNAAIKKLDAAIKEEKKQTTHSDEMAKNGAKPAALAEAKKEQEDNHKKTDEVKDLARTIGNLDAAVKPLEASDQSMSQAEGSLGAGKVGAASPSQTKAGKQMEEAKKALEQARQQVIADLQKQIKGVVIANLRDMLERQTAVRGATQALSDRLAKERTAVLQLQQLAPAEERIATICQQTLDLVNETEFSVALPPALEDLQRNMMYVAGDLSGGRGDQRVVGVETGVESDLRDLLQTFEELTEDGKPGECKGCKGDKNKLIAELKVVRMLQLRVNKDTLDADGDAHRAAAAADLPKELRDTIGHVRDAEDSVRGAMERIHDRFGPGAPSSPQEEEPRDPNAI